jgi:hypothetical protein
LFGPVDVAFTRTIRDDSGDIRTLRAVVGPGQLVVFHAAGREPEPLAFRKSDDSRDPEPLIDQFLVLPAPVSKPERFTHGPAICPVTEPGRADQR